MFFKIFPSHPALHAIIDYYWYTQADLTQSVVQEVHTPLLQGMTFNLSGRKEKMQFPGAEIPMSMADPVYVFGQALSHRLSISNDTGIDIFGVKFTANGFHLLTGEKMQYLTDKIVDAEAIWGKEIHYVCEALYDQSDPAIAAQLLNRFFYARMRQAKPRYVHPAVSEALELIHAARGAIRMQTLQKQLHTSTSTLERIFLHQLGMSPKLYSRIYRFNQAKARIDAGTTDWQDICFDFGYFDQSHFIREFKQYTGVTPERYIQKSKPLENVF